jgi:hypothetical protein
MEKKIREHLSGGEVSSNDCFTSRLINPIYDFKANNKDFSTIIYLITITLWLISSGKLYNKYKNGEIQSIYDFSL